MSGLSLETAGKTLKCILPSLEAAFVPVDKASNGFTRVGLVFSGKGQSHLAVLSHSEPEPSTRCW